MVDESAGCPWCAIERASAVRLNPGEPRICPECDHVFRGHGWDGIDAHWKAKHDRASARYAEVWAGIGGCPRHHA